jgi:putative addiction module component (TIGR02574 family)
MTRAQIEQLLELPSAERLEIVHELWESVVRDSQAVPLTAGQRDELERRWLDLQEHPDDAESWDDVKTSLRAE